jgi:MFS transporter, DHA1 family, tetracycline resistance protein
MEKQERPDMSESNSSPVDVPNSEAAPADSPPASSQERSALLIVSLVMFIDLLGFGIVLPLLPRYGKEFLEPLYPGPDNSHIRGALLGLLMASFSIMQFVFAPLWGRISDRVGRRPFLLLGLAGSVTFYALFGFASHWGAEPGRQAVGLALLFVARIGAGIAGATVSIAQAVIADCTPPDRRSRGMALIGAAFGIGFTFGPMLGAGAIKYFGRGGPGYAASAFSLVAFVLGMLLMPETVRPGATTHKRGWLNLHGLQLALRTPTVGLLILTYFVSVVAFANFEPTLSLFTGDVLHYDDEQNFWVFVYVGFVLALVQGGLYRGLARRGISETTFMLVGSFLTGLGFAALAAAGWPGAATGVGNALLVAWIFAALATAITGFAFVQPSVASLVSRRIDPTHQGEVLGVNQSANALSRILGPIIGTSLYYVWPPHVLPYAFAVVMGAVVLVLSMQVRQVPGHGGVA